MSLKSCFVFFKVFIYFDQSLKRVKLVDNLESTIANPKEYSANGKRNIL